MIIGTKKKRNKTKNIGEKYQRFRINSTLIPSQKWMGLFFSFISQRSNMYREYIEKPNSLELCKSIPSITTLQSLIVKCHILELGKYK